MHPNPAFHIKDREWLTAFARDIGFGTLFAASPNGPSVAHIPFIITEDCRFRFHLAQGNDLADYLNGNKALLLINGPHAYISPDWYGPDDQVPTWNYVAAELRGRVTQLDQAGLVDILDELSRVNEARLAPKRPWVRTKMSTGLFERMNKVIIGYEFEVIEWRGTAKLNQNKPAAQRLQAAAALDAEGQVQLSALMREPPE